MLTQLQPSVEAAKLLQMKKSTAKDAEAICELCTHLNPLQVSPNSLHIHIQLVLCGCKYGTFVGVMVIIMAPSPLLN